MVTRFSARETETNGPVDRLTQEPSPFVVHEQRRACMARKRQLVKVSRLVKMSDLFSMRLHDCTY